MPGFGALLRGSLDFLARHDWGWADTECSVCHMRRGCRSYLDRYYCMYCLPFAIKRSEQTSASTAAGEPPTPTGPEPGTSLVPWYQVPPSQERE